MPDHEARIVVAGKGREALAAYAVEIRAKGGSLPAPHHAVGTVAA
jgi:hypothetical protein